MYDDDDENLLPSQLLQRVDEACGRATEPLRAYVDDGRLQCALADALPRRLAAAAGAATQSGGGASLVTWSARLSYTLYYPRELRLCLQTLTGHVLCVTGVMGELASRVQLSGLPGELVSLAVTHDAGRQDTPDSLVFSVVCVARSAAQK